MAGRQTTDERAYHQRVEEIADNPEVGDYIVFRDGGHGYKWAVLTRVNNEQVRAMVEGTLVEKVWVRADWRKEVWSFGSILPHDHIPPLPDLTDNQVGALISLVSRARDRETIHVYLATDDEPLAVCGFCRHEILDGAVRQGHTPNCEGELLRTIGVALQLWFQERVGDNRRQREREAKEGKK